MAAGSGGKGSARSIKSEKLGAQLEAYRKRLHAFILRRLRHKADAEDAVQAVFERVLSYLDRGGSINRLPSLIYRTAVNLVIDKAREPDIIDYISDTGVPDIPQNLRRNEPQEAVEAEEMLQRLEEQLSPLNREFLEYWTGGMTFDEIAAAKGITRRTVETYRTRLRRACKAAWKGE